MIVIVMYLCVADSNVSMRWLRKMIYLCADDSLVSMYAHSPFLTRPSLAPQLPPVQRTGFWSKPEIYPDPVTVRAAACDYRNVRGVCVGYPEVQNQTALQLCLYHPHSPWCTRTFHLQDSSSASASDEGSEMQEEGGVGGAGLSSWPNITGLPSDQRGGRSDFLYGGTFMEEAWGNGVDKDTFVGRTYNRSRLYRDDAHCRAGYQGRMCSECADSYYRVLDGTCDKCPWWGFFITYLAWFGIWGIACSLLCLCAMGQSHFARVLVSVAQGVHLVSRFQINWPPLPMYGLRVFAIFNFSLEMLPWTCYGINMPWIDMWFLSLFIPYVVTGACAVRYLAPYLVTTAMYFRARRKMNHWKARFDEWPNNPVHKLRRLWARISQHPVCMWLRQRYTNTPSSFVHLFCILIPLSCFRNRPLLILAHTAGSATSPQTRARKTTPRPPLPFLEADLVA